MRKAHLAGLLMLFVAAVEGEARPAAGDPPAAGPPASNAPPAVAAARAHWAAHGYRVLAEFCELLAIPNVAADPAGLVRNAEWLRDALARRGAAAELLEIEGVPPAVYATLPAPGATRTLGIYVHYDGQPVDPAR